MTSDELDQSLTTHFDLLGAIFKEFGYEESWCVYPIIDSRECLWAILGSDTDGEVKYADTQEEWDSDGDYFVDEIYTQRFLEKWVYRAKSHTLILVYTSVDGNCFLRVFANKNERPE